MHSDITWKCWNAEGHADTRPPGNWMEYGFDDSAWPNAVPYGRNDADDTHWSAYIPRKPGYPETSGHVKPGISDEAECIWTADPEVHNDVFCRGNFYSGDRLRSTPPPQPPLSPRDSFRTLQASALRTSLPQPPFRAAWRPWTLESVPRTRLVPAPTAAPLWPRGSSGLTRTTSAP